MNKVVFNYGNEKIEIQYQPEDKIKNIFQKFCLKVDKNIKDLLFYYMREIINEDFKLSQIESNLKQERHIINILVYEKKLVLKKKNFEKSKDIICPDCGEEARIDIKNFKFSLFCSSNGHKNKNLSVDEFAKKQNIDISKTICNICKKNSKSDSKNKKFYYCFICRANLCELCKSAHDKSHKIENFEQRNYLCQEHFSNYIKYCEQCKKNMCIECEKEHIQHQTILFNDILADKKNYIQEINFLGDLVNKFKEEINYIINILMNISDNINNYYKIANSFIKARNIENINYNLLKNISTFIEYNNIIKSQITQFINTDNLDKKFDYLNNLIENNIKSKFKNPLIENMSLSLTVKNDSEVTTIIPLKNQEDIAVCLANGFLFVYNIKTFKEKLAAKITNKTILDIIILDDNKVCISCWDFIIRIIQFYNDNTQYKIIQELKDHTNFINCLKKSLFLKNQILFFSSSNDGRVLLWKYDKMNKLFKIFKEFKIYQIENMNMNDGLQLESLEESIKFQKLICGASTKRSIYFCDLNNVSPIEKIKINVNRCIRALKIIDDDFLIIAGYKEINILNIKDKVILYTIGFHENIEFNCIYQRKNGNILISEFGQICKIREFEFNKKTASLNLLSTRENDFENYITTMTESIYGDLIVGGYDKRIKYFYN